MSSCHLFSSTLSRLVSLFLSFFFFNDPSTTEIYTLSLHDALPISVAGPPFVIATLVEQRGHDTQPYRNRDRRCDECSRDRKSTRLNSSHTVISYAVFCLKKKKQKNKITKEYKIKTDNTRTTHTI